MMKMKVDVKLDTTKPESGWDKESPRFCSTRPDKYRDGIALSQQIEVPQLKAFLSAYLNHKEDVVSNCHFQTRKSMEVRVELMTCQEFQVETIKGI